MPDVPIGVHHAIASDPDVNRRFPISDRRSRPLILVGRLKPGVARDQANAQLKVIAAAHEQAYPDDNKHQGLVVGTLDRLDISTGPQDDTQTWVRTAIGASPADVLRLVVRGSLATTAAGLAIGLGLAMLLGWGLRAAIYQISP